MRYWENEKNIEIYVSEGPFVVKGLTELNKVTISSAGTSITLDKDFSDDEKYFIFITKKQDKLVGSIYNKIFGKYAEEDLNSTSETASVVICTNIFGVYKVMYYDCNSDENTQNLMNNTLMYLNSHSSKNPKYNADIFQKTSKSKYNGVLNTLRSVFKMNEVNSIFGTLEDSLKKPQTILFSYMVYEMDASVDERYLVAEEDSTEPVSSGFDKWVDELPFQNFESYIATGGNCAGITHLSSYLYNTKSVPTSFYFFHVAPELDNSLNKTRKSTLHC